MLKKCRSSLLRSRSWLEMAARACPGAAAGSKWPLKPAPEPQSSLARSRKMFEKCCSSMPRSRRMLEKCRSSLLRSHRWLEMSARACPRTAAGSKWPLKPAPEPQNARKVLLKPECCSSLPRSRSMLEKCRSSLPRSHSTRSKWPLKPAPEPQNARKVLLKPGPQPRNAREVLFEPAPQPRSARKVPLAPAPEPQHALEKYCILFVCYRHQLLLSSTLLRWARSCWGVRIGRSNPLGLAAPSTRQSRTKTNRPGQAKPTQRRFAGRGRGCLLHSEPARPRWGARPDRA